MARKSKLNFTRIGDTLFVCDETTRDLVLEENIVPEGHAAIFEDGSSEWVIDEIVSDTSKTGSDMFTWDKSGNRVKYERCRYRKTADGVVTREVEKTVFKSF